MFKMYVSPVYNIKKVPINKIIPNSYNPNKVAHRELDLLKLSILKDGYTMPIVCYYEENKDIYTIVDGFHRFLVMKNSKEIFDRENGCLPVSVIYKPIEERIASTIRHNRARGEHEVDSMINIVTSLVNEGVTDEWLEKNLGMDNDEILRLKQVSGITELFSNSSFSNSWIMGDLI
ncbi:IbrB-like domain-containing protein [Enterococcus faecalis]|uniref:IbrB-like domain-containing protein n=1 Tax=Enterococcus faecalis TaxID=1351 RepID=UPI0017851462|nr:ParB/RepB/Spo0J family partition protein [Enterococcus faecalis]MBD9891332.1 ParB-like nuclease domain-containing protein [Enterococcus faecalis]